MGTIVLALTANPYYTIDGVRPATTLATAAHQLHLAPAIHAGRNDWYIIPGIKSDGVLKVRHGIYQRDRDRQKDADRPPRRRAAAAALLLESVAGRDPCSMRVGGS